MHVAKAPFWSADVSEDETRDAASSAVEHFAELIRILDHAMAEATLLADRDLVKQLARAKGAAQQSKELLDKLCGSVSSDD